MIVSNQEVFSIFGINTAQAQAIYNNHVQNWTAISYGNIAVTRFIPNVYNPPTVAMGYFTDLFKCGEFSNGWQAIPTFITAVGLSFMFRKPDGSYSKTAPI
jgi:hypothetical protein